MPERKPYAAGWADAAVRWGVGWGTADRRYICSKEVSSMAVVSWQGGQGQGEAEP